MFLTVNKDPNQQCVESVFATLLYGTQLQAGQFPPETYLENQPTNLDSFC